MNSARAAQLLEVNRRFYRESARDFAETRGRVQPGVRQVIQSLQPDESILDLGCGSGAFPRALSQEGHRGAYLGLDFSPELLERARRASYRFPVAFQEVDLASPVPRPIPIGSMYDSAPGGPRPNQGQTWDVVTAFAVLHHIPGHTLRLSLLQEARGWLQPHGRLILSNWQFSTSPRMQARIVPWSALGMAADDVDTGDYLIDWRRGAPGVRYVHEFHHEELTALAAQSGFEVTASFLADGADGRSGLYQTWQPK